MRKWNTFKKIDINFKWNYVTIDDESNIAKNVYRTYKFRSIFLKKLAFFKYNVYFILKNNVYTLEFIIYFKVVKHDIFSNDVFK